MLGQTGINNKLRCFVFFVILWFLPVNLQASDLIRQTLDKKDADYFNEMAEDLEKIKQKVFPDKCLKTAYEISDECKYFYEKAYMLSKGDPAKYNNKIIPPQCHIGKTKASQDKTCIFYQKKLVETKNKMLQTPRNLWPSFVNQIISSYSKR